jgi:hypothetical protein
LDEVGPLEAQPIALQWQEGKAQMTVGGGRLKAEATGPAPTLAAWPDDVSFTLGDPAAHGWAWTGSVERLAVHRGNLSAEVLAQDAAVPLTLPVAAPRLRLKARLLEATTPNPAALDTYTRMLVDHTYEVVQVLEGEFKEPRIVVLHWGILDSQVLPGVPREPGEVFELTVEPHAEHPQLEPELTVTSSEDYEATLYFDVDRPTFVPPRGQS